MKKFFAISMALALALTTIGCTANNAPKESAQVEATKSLEGKYVGYSWKGEAEGVEFKDSKEYIETILELDEKGIIKDAKMRFFVNKNGFWETRQSGNAYVNVDFTVDPVPATPGDDYKAGKSMFTIHTADMMSFYATAVDSSGVTAVAIVDPVTRYQFEMKLPKDFNFETPMADMTIGSGMIVPTIRTSGGGLLKPAEWDSLGDKTILSISPWSHVVTSRGTLEGITETSSVKEFLQALGVEFNGNQPQTMDAKYGYFGNGGWNGNYRAIETELIGKDATQMTSLIDWSIPRYAEAINDKNQFGVDAPTGATKTVQNSADGISGATVRMSREATSYQRALVEAGIIKESDVIIGRF